MKLIGIPVIEAPAEAEAQCSMLVQEGLAASCLSDSPDALVFGCPCVTLYYS
jgi:5'-3' exonuclease